MPPLYWVHRNTKPSEPVLVVCMDGWIDSGYAAQMALRTVLGQLPNEVIVSFDTDDFLDHRSRRPTLQITDGVNMSIEWPQIELRLARTNNGNDIAFLVGPEPDFRWNAFTEAVGDLATDMGTRMVVGLGAFPAPAPHTRPVKLTCTATSASLADQVGYLTGTIEVPAGIESVLERTFDARGIPAIGLWARVPHYVAAMSYPPASAALVDGLSKLTGIALSSQELHDQAEETRNKIDNLISQSEEHKEMVRMLELHVDTEQDRFQENADFQFGNLPTGDEIAAELENFLKKRTKLTDE